MAFASNLIGQRFGKLVVVKREPNNKKGNTMWLCQCDCGRTKVALGYDLTHGRTVSCGCKNVGKPAPIREDITGQRFGTLTAMSVNEECSSPGRVLWNCVCDCGATTVVAHGNLKSGHIKSHPYCPLKSKPYNFIDLTGKRFGRLTVVREEGKKNACITWLCQCDCGNMKITTGNLLKSGRVKSCGCLSDENRRKGKRFTHHMSKTKLYQKYRAMRNRCSPTYHGAKHYYKRGIRVCDEWSGENGFLNFRKWSLENGFDESKSYLEMTLDRIDVNGDYSPENCRWTDMHTQTNNRTNNAYVKYNGERKTLKMWSEELGLSYGMLKARHQRGMTPPELFQPPMKRYKKYKVRKK